MGLSEQLAAEATRAGDDATGALVDSRMWEILLEWRPERPDIRDQHTLYSGVAATKAARAQALANRAGVPETTFTDAKREELANSYTLAMEAQELLEEKAANAELWGLTPEEIALERARIGDRQGVVPMDSPAQLRANALVGRARVQALREWLDSHPERDVPVADGESTTTVI